MWIPRQNRQAEEEPRTELAPPAADPRKAFLQQISTLFTVRNKGLDPLSFQQLAQVHVNDKLLLEVRLDSHFGVGSAPEVRLLDASGDYLKAIELLIAAGLLQPNSTLAYQHIFGYRYGLHGSNLIYNIVLMFELCRYLSAHAGLALPGRDAPEEEVA